MVKTHALQLREGRVVSGWCTLAHDEEDICSLPDSMVDNTSEIRSLSNVRCILRNILPVGKALIFKLVLPISDNFPTTNQFCWHFAVSFRVLTAVSHLAQKSTKVYKGAPFWATIVTFSNSFL